MRQLIAAFLLVPATVLAYDGERAKNNLAQDTAAGLQKRGEKAAEFSIELSTPDVARARHELAIKTMMRELKDTWDNISIINNKYGYPCIDLMENPKARMQYWLDKKN